MYKNKMTSKNSLSRKNLLINGQFNVSQKNKNKLFKVDNLWNVIDKWYSYLEGSLEVSGQQLTSLDRNIKALNKKSACNFTNGLLLKCDSPFLVEKDKDIFGMLQYIENHDLNFLSNKVCTLSFWIKSSVKGTYHIVFKFGENRSYIAPYEIFSTNEWEYKIITIKIDNFTNHTSIKSQKDFYVYFGFRLNTKSQTISVINKWMNGNYYGTSKQAKWGESAFDIIAFCGVQLELNNENTSFENMSYENELKLCQKDYKNPIETVTEVPVTKPPLKKRNKINSKNNKYFIKIESGDLLLPTKHVSENRLFHKDNFKHLLFKPTTAVGANFINVKGKTYVHALKSIDLSLKSSDSLALIGHNGSGKTSLLKACAGIYPLSGGKISSCGVISNFISQGLGANQEMSAAEYLQMQCVFRNFNKDQSQELIKNVLEFIDLGEFSFMPMRTYSAGMQARVYASAALFFPGEILLIDEGLSAGDSLFSKKFRKKIETFYQDSKILIAASHDDRFLQKWCERGLVMKKGKSIFIGDIDSALDFYHSDKYHKYNVE